MSDPQISASHSEDINTPRMNTNILVKDIIVNKKSSGFFSCLSSGKSASKLKQTSDQSLSTNEIRSPRKLSDEDNVSVKTYVSSSIKSSESAKSIEQLVTQKDNESVKDKRKSVKKKLPKDDKHFSAMSLADDSKDNKLSQNTKSIKDNKKSPRKSLCKPSDKDDKKLSQDTMPTKKDKKSPRKALLNLSKGDKLERKLSTAKDKQLSNDDTISSSRDIPFTTKCDSNFESGGNGSLDDPRMGAVSLNVSCQYCDRIDCPGHYGLIEFNSKS